MDWTMVGKTMGTGIVAGGLDSYIQDMTNKQIVAFDKKKTDPKKELSILSQYSTWYNYGVPLALLGATAFGIGGGVIQRNLGALLTAAGAIAGRKAGSQLIEYGEKTKEPAAWRAYGGEAARAAAEASRAAAAAQGRMATSQVGSRGSL
jgi:hypothetical protein